MLEVDSAQSSDRSPEVNDSEFLEDTKVQEYDAELVWPVCVGIENTDE